MSGVWTCAKALAALVALVALIVGVPAALAVIVGWPLPRAVPDAAAVWDALAIGNVPTAVIVNALACVVWLAWAQIAVSAVLETKAVLQGRMPRPVRGLASPIQLGVGKLVATAALLITMAPRAGMALPATTVPLPQVMPVVATVATPSNAGLLSVAQPASVTVQAPITAASFSASSVWTVARGDNLWDIAEAVLGSGERWPEIYELNHGVVQPDGRALTDPGVLERGWELRLPEVSPGGPVDQPDTGTTVAEPSTSAAPEQATYAVERGDSLWSIAEQALGDGHRYLDLYALNVGVAQADGGCLVDPGVIEPGWVLTLPVRLPPVVSESTVTQHLIDEAPSVPTEAEVTPADAPGPTTPDSPNESAQPEESTTSTTEAHAPTPTAASSSDELEPAGSPPPTLAPEPTDVPLPIPDAPARPSTTTTDQSPDALAETIAPLAADGQQASDVDLEATRESPQPEDGRDVLGLAGGVLAVGLWAALRRRRRHRSIRRRPGAVTPAVDDDLVDVIGAMRSGALDSPALPVANLLRTLTTGHGRRRGAAEPEPVAVLVGPDVVSVMLRDATGSPPAGWSASVDERHWEHPRRHRLPDVDATSPLPALVTIGGTSDEPVLLDLEAAGVISITGDDVAVYDLVRSMILELAETPFADSISVLVDGLDLPDLDGLARLESIDDLSDVLAELDATAAQYGQALAEAGHASCFAARAADATGDGLPPTVVFTTSTADEVVQIARSLPSSSGAALVVLGEIDAPALEVRVDAEHVEVPELGIRCRVQQLDVEAAELIGRALAAAAADPPSNSDEAIVAGAMRAVRIGSEVEDQPADSVLDLRDTAATEVPPYEDPAFEVCVKMLGPVTVTGARATPTAQQEAILSYLVTHRTADSLALQEALWRDNQPRKSRLHDVLYELRRSLGSEVLPATADNTNPLGPLVVSDLELFDRRVEAAREQAPAVAVETLCGALDLVRGVPFTYGARAARYYTWVDVENFISTWEHTVADVAHEVSKWFHHEGDASTAAWAARQGLLASPLNEALTCDLMLSHDLAGDSRAAQSVFDEHERALEALGLGEAGDDLIATLEEVRFSRPHRSPSPASAAS